jgi:hypothetical protein
MANCTRRQEDLLIRIFYNHFADRHFSMRLKLSKDKRTAEELRALGLVGVAPTNSGGRTAWLTPAGDGVARDILGL